MIRLHDISSNVKRLLLTGLFFTAVIVVDLMMQRFQKIVGLDLKPCQFRIAEFAVGGRNGLLCLYLAGRRLTRLKTGINCMASLKSDLSRGQALVVPAAHYGRPSSTFPHHWPHKAGDSRAPADTNDYFIAVDDGRKQHLQQIYRQSSALGAQHNNLCSFISRIGASVGLTNILATISSPLNHE